MRINQLFTIAAGAPINVGTGGAASDGIPRYASRVFVQMQHGGSGLGLIMDGIANKRVPNSAVGSDLTAELSAASALSPGGSFEDWDKSLDRGGINMTEMWIDGSHTGDTVLVSYVPKI